MTLVVISPVSGGTNGLAYRAVSGDREAQGVTAGAALDALAAQLPADEAEPLVIVQERPPDRSFGAVQQQRLARLVESELNAAEARATDQYPVADFLEPIQYAWTESGYQVREAIKRYSEQTHAD